MATTYSYGGEFSSDEDIDRIEARQHQAKFQDSTKPDKRQLEATIDAIRSMPASSDVVLTDEVLAGLLEYYKTQRGPIVDSTRALYKKIVLRLIRGEQAGQPINGDHKEPTNGVSNNNNLLESQPQLQSHKQPVDEIGSSDEDEPMLANDAVASVDSIPSTRKKLDPRVVYMGASNNVEPMEVDTDAARDAMMMRLSKQIDLSSTDDDGDQSDTEASSDQDDSNDSELLDVTPIKPVASAKVVTQAPNQKALASSKSSTDYVVRKRVTTSTPNKVITSEVKKPYTRSQRVTTRASSSAVDDKSTTTTKQDSAPVRAAAPSAGLKTTARRSIGLKSLVVLAAIVICLALVLYYFRLNLKSSTDHIMRGIKF